MPADNLHPRVKLGERQTPVWLRVLFVAIVLTFDLLPRPLPHWAKNAYFAIIIVMAFGWAYLLTEGRSWPLKLLAAVGAVVLLVVIRASGLAAAVIGVAIMASVPVGIIVRRRQRRRDNAAMA